MGSIIPHHKSPAVIKVKRLNTVGCRAKKLLEVITPNSWSDDICFIIGGGPSLQGFNFQQLSKYRTIGINKVFKEFHPTINYAMDYNFFDSVQYTRDPRQPDYELHQKWLAYPGIKLFLRHDHTMVFTEGIHYVNEIGSKMISYDLDKGIYPGNNCYDDQTEILTENGFKLFKDLLAEERVVTLSSIGEVEYQFPIERQIDKYSGDLIYFQGRKIDLMVTPNHRMFVGDSHARRSSFKIKRAEELEKNHKKSSFSAEFSFKGKKKETFILPAVTRKQYNNFIEEKPCSEIIWRPEKQLLMDDWLLFFGLWLGDGCTHISKNKKTGKVQGYFTSICQQKPEVKLIIERVLKSLDFKYYKGQLEKCSYYDIEDKQLCLYLRQFGKSKDKFIPREIFNLPNEQLQYLFKGLMLTDGDGLTENRTFFTSSKKLADSFFELGLRLGFHPSVVENHRPVTIGEYYYPDSEGYVIYLKKINITASGILPQKVNYVGNVYCVTVPNGIIFVRRNGKGCWCGNSGFGALMVAIALGCRKIALLGYDFTIQGSKTHWHEGYGKQDIENVKNNLISYRKCIDEFGSTILSMGVQVFNLNPSSALQSFPHTDLNTFIS